MGNVDCSIDDGIATVTFTNPPKGCLTSAMVVQLGAIMTALEADDAVRVIVFTGGLPDVFIRHFSVEEIIEMAAAIRARALRGARRVIHADALQRWSRRRRLHVTVGRLVHAVSKAQVPQSKARHVATEGAGPSRGLARAGPSPDPDMGARYPVAEVRRAGIAAVAARRVEPKRVRGSGVHRRAVFGGG